MLMHVVACVCRLMSHAQPRTAASGTPWCWVEIQDEAPPCTKMKVKAFYKNASYLAKLEFMHTYCFNKFMSNVLSCSVKATEI
jgi:hypothetical protein